MMDRAEWLKGLNVGDEVAITAFRTPPRICRVKAVTRYKITANHSDFGRTTGRTKGDWRNSEIVPVTAEHREQVEFQALKRWMHEIVDGFREETPTISLMQLRAMHRAYNDANS